MKKAALRDIGKTIGKWMPDLLVVAGAFCIAYGAYLFFPPLGYIAGGVLLIGGAYIWSKSTERG